MEKPYEKEQAGGSFNRPIEDRPLEPTRPEQRIPEEYLPKPYYPNKPLPQEQKPLPPKTLPEFDEKANRELKPFGRRVVKDKNYELMKWGIIIFGVLALAFGYAILNDSFKTTIDCPTLTCPKIPENVPCPSCSCPNNSCSVDCGDCNFPNSININLTNGTG